MSGEDPAALAELLCARLCHDLAGVVGAIGTGVELLVDESADGDLAAEALTLLTGSAASAVARLKFLRLALGSVQPPMSSNQARSLIGDFLFARSGEAGMMRLEWRDALADWSGDELKLLFNLVLITSDCLPAGGMIGVERSASVEAGGMRVSAEGAMVKAGEAVGALHAGGTAGLRPRGAQGYYSALLARRMGLSINYEDSHERVVFVTIKN